MMLLSLSEYYNLMLQWSGLCIDPYLVQGWLEYKPTQNRKCCICFYLTILNEFNEDIKKKIHWPYSKQRTFVSNAELLYARFIYELCSSYWSDCSRTLCFIRNRPQASWFPWRHFLRSMPWLGPYLFHCDLIWQSVILVLTLTRLWLLKTCLKPTFCCFFSHKAKSEDSVQKTGATLL